MQNSENTNQSNQWFGEPSDQNVISYTENVYSDQSSSSSSMAIQSQKRQRKQPKNAKKSDLQQTVISNASNSFVQPQYLPTPVADTKPQYLPTSVADTKAMPDSPDHQPSIGQVYVKKNLYANRQVPPQNQQHAFAQAAQMLAAFNPYSHIHSPPWLPLPVSPTTTAYNPFDQQQRVAVPTMFNFMSSPFFQNNSLSTAMAQQYPRSPLPATTMLPTYPQSTIGFKESNQSARYDLNHSPMYSETVQPESSSQSMSNKKSKISNVEYELQHTTPSTSEASNGTKKDNTAVNNESGRIEDIDNEGVLVIDEKYDFSCVICQDTKKDTVLMPCKHLCVCEKCSKNIDLCPLCRKEFDESMTVFT